MLYCIIDPYYKGGMSGIIKLPQFSTVPWVTIINLMRLDISKLI